MVANPVPPSPTLRATTIIPPYMGWNTRDPLANMGAEYAPEIENFFPVDGAVTLRNGYTKHVKTTSGGGYAHLAELVNTAGTRFLIGFIANGASYDVTAAGAGTAITGGYSLGSPEVYTVNYRGRLYAKGYASGANTDMYSTDGAAATLPAFTGPGGDDKDLWRLATYKNRLYALSISDASMWYTSTVDAITGAMIQYDFQSLLTLGGKPWFIGRFSMTGGDISQEYFLVISQQGEVLLFSGSYPGSVSWELVGSYFIPNPAGRKSFFNWGTDVLVVTVDGLVSIKEVIGSPGSEYTFVSDSINTAFKQAVADVQDYLGGLYLNFIQGIVYPKGQYLLVNFFGASPIQYVMNTQTRAWTKFTGQGAISWALLNNNLYWGSVAGLASFIAKADNGYYDEDPDNAGAALTRTIKLRHAFNYLGQPTKRKRFVQAQPTVYQSEGLSITLNCDVDFSNDTATSTETDTSRGTDYQIYQPMCGLAADSGSAVSIRIDGTVTTKRFSLQATKVYWDEGTDE